MMASDTQILVVFIPEDFLEPVKQALFLAGAGEFPNYSQCCFEQKGVGQFMPNDNANPFLGKLNKVERVTEYRVEFFCQAQKVQAIIQALLTHHPYEQPAYYLLDTVRP